MIDEIKAVLPADAVAWQHPKLGYYLVVADEFKASRQIQKLVGGEVVKRRGRLYFFGADRKVKVAVTGPVPGWTVAATYEFLQDQKLRYLAGGDVELV